MSAFTSAEEEVIRIFDVHLFYPHPDTFFPSREWAGVLCSPFVEGQPLTGTDDTSSERQTLPALLTAVSFLLLIVRCGSSPWETVNESGGAGQPGKSCQYLERIEGPKWKG